MDGAAEDRERARVSREGGSGDGDRLGARRAVGDGCEAAGGVAVHGGRDPGCDVAGRETQERSGIRGVHALLDAREVQTLGQAVVLRPDADDAHRVPVGRA